jgi:hypothetical protein
MIGLRKINIRLVERGSALDRAVGVLGQIGLWYGEAPNRSAMDPTFFRKCTKDR